jgi:hypothetical protein
MRQRKGSSTEQKEYGLDLDRLASSLAGMNGVVEVRGGEWQVLCEEL